MIPSHLAIFVALVAISPIVGSFLGVLIRRIPRNEPFAGGRSHCETCGTTLTARDLIPILSYVGTRGECRHCGQPVAAQHLWVELAATSIPIVAALAHLSVSHGQDGFTTDLPGDCVLGWALLALAWIDRACLRLPDAITLPMLLAGLLEGCATAGPGGLRDRAIGAVFGWLILASVRYGYRLLRKREGLGGGDVKLLAMGGAWTGAAPLPTIVLIAAIFGLLGAMTGAGTAAWRNRHGPNNARGRLTMTTLIPFGPCLAAAIWLARLAKCLSPAPIS